MEGKIPYIWIRSGKLRNPLNDPQPVRKGRPVYSAKDERRPESSTSSRSARLVKTTTSTNWFQTSHLPEYIKGKKCGTDCVPPLKQASLMPDTTKDSKQLNGLLESDNQRVDNATGILSSLNNGTASDNKTKSAKKKIKYSNDLKELDNSQNSTPEYEFCVVNGDRHQVPTIQYQEATNLDIDESEETMDVDFQALCPNVNRRSSSLAGLKSIMNRLGTPTESPPPITESRPKSTYAPRSRKLITPQPRTSSARIHTRNHSEKRPVSSALSGDGRATTAGSASTGMFLEQLLAEQGDEFSDECSEVPSPRPVSRSLQTRLTKPALRPVTAAQTSAKVQRLLDERFRTMYRSRRTQSATIRGIPLTPSTRGASSHGGLDPRSRSPRPATPQPAQKEGENEEAPKTWGKFRMLAKLALQLNSVLRASIQRSCDMTTRSATELQWLTVYAEREDTTLTFNKHLFSRARVITHVPDWAQEILSLSPEERTVTHCRRLHALLRGLKSFDKFTEEIQMALCRAFTMERVEERRVVLRKGHAGLNFYFIYSGSVFVNQDDTTKDGSTFVRTVAVLARGDSFGELALLQDIRRTATITVRERCELLVVDKNVFGRVCPAIFEKELAEKYNFIRSLTLFSGKWWSQDALNYLSMNSQIQEYKTNKVIAVDSVLEDWIFACMEGRCQVVRCLCLDRPQKEKGDRRNSEIVLSEEILQLLSSTAIDDRDSGGDPAVDTRENLLTSLGLDYVNTGKKLASMDVTLTEQKRVRLGVDGASTLTSLMKKQREVLKKELVYLNLGSITAGEIFDLQSLVDETHVNEDDPSSLMLISGGSKMLKIRKGAFYESANQQALDHTRTLASKQRNPSETIILDSYKEKMAWDTYKDNIVNTVIKAARQRNAPTYRDTRKQVRAKSALQSREAANSQIIHALERGKSIVPELKFTWSDDEEDEESEDDVDGSERTKIQSRMGETESIFQAILRDSEQNKTGQPRFADLVIMNRKPPPPGKKKKVSKEPEPPVKPYYRRLLDAKASSPVTHVL